MKNIAITLLFILSLSPDAGAQFAFEGGINLANLSLKSAGNKVTTSFKTGAAFGFVIDMEIADNIYFQPGVFYLMNGCTLKDPKGSYNINTLTFPLNIEYKSGEKCSSRFFAGAGPYIGDNISGDYIIEDNGIIPGTSGKLTIGSDKNANLKALDLGIGANIGYQLKKRLYLRIRYQAGLVNLTPGGDNKNSMKTSSIGITLGCLFASCGSGRGGSSFRVHGGNHWKGMSKGKYSRKPHPPRYPQ